MSFLQAHSSKLGKSYSGRRVRVMASPEIFFPTEPPKEKISSPLQHVRSPGTEQDAAAEESTREWRSTRSYSSNSPTEVTTLDHQIAAGGGTTSTLENTPSRLRASKAKRPVSQKQWIEELTKDNGYLRQELAYYKDVQQALLALHGETARASAMLEEALENFSQRIAESEKPLLDYWQIDSMDETRLL